MVEKRKIFTVICACGIGFASYTNCISAAALDNDTLINNGQKIKQTLLKYPLSLKK